MRKLLHSVIIIFLVMEFQLGIESAQAVTPPVFIPVTVDTLVDSNDPAYQACTEETDGDCSLRGAISAANAETGENTVYIINIPTGSYTLTLTGSREDLNATGDLDIIDGIVTVVGAGAGNTVINAGQIDRVLNVHTGATVEMNGVTITGGLSPVQCPDSSCSAEDNEGGGIYNDGGLTLRQCAINDNTTGGATWEALEGGRGGGIYNSGTLSLDNTTLNGNTTGTGGSGHVGGNGGPGGAIFNTGILYLTNSSLSMNSSGNGGNSTSADVGGAGGAGGGLYNTGIAQLEYSHVISNTTGDGGMTPTQTSAVGGDGGQGGGIFNTGTLTLTSSTVNLNIAGDGGHTGGAYGGSGGDGGAVYNAGTFTVIQSSLNGNSAGDSPAAGGSLNPENHGGDGGGIYNNGTAIVQYSSINDNNTGEGGDRTGMTGGNGHRGGHGGGVYNSDFLQISDSSILTNTTGSGGLGGSMSGSWGGYGGSGGGIYNLGQLTGDTLSVSNNSTGNGGYGSGNAQYNPSTGYGGDGGNGAGIYSGGAMTLSGSTISGNITGNGGEGHAYSQCTAIGGRGGIGGGLYNKASLILKTVTISNNTTGEGGVATCSPTDCTANGGEGGDGAGIYQEHIGSLTFTHGAVKNNQTGAGGTADGPSPTAGTGGDGAGLFNTNNELVFAGITISGNTTKVGDGGGLYNEDNNAYFINTAFTGNGAFGGQSGGGIYCDYGAPQFVNVLINGNWADSYGGGLYGVHCNAKLTNTTLGGNTAGWDLGGAIYNQGPGIPELYNSIVWDNNGGHIDIAASAGVPFVQYSIVEGGYSGTGNLYENPNFIREATPGPDGNWFTLYNNDFGDYHLTSNSGAIDAADNNAVPVDIADIDGDNDFAETLPDDLDSANRFADVHWIADIGNGTTPIVDMGAYEYLGWFTYSPLITRE